MECETKSVVQTLIVTFSFKYQEYQHKLKTRQLDRARKTVEEVNKKNQNAKKKKDIEKIKNKVQKLTFILFCIILNLKDDNLIKIFYNISR